MEDLQNCIVEANIKYLHKVGSSTLPFLAKNHRNKVALCGILCFQGLILLRGHGDSIRMGLCSHLQNSRHILNITYRQNFCFPPPPPPILVDFLQNSLVKQHHWNWLGICEKTWVWGACFVLRCCWLAYSWFRPSVCFYLQWLKNLIGRLRQLGSHCINSWSSSSSCHFSHCGKSLLFVGKVGWIQKH